MPFIVSHLNPSTHQNISSNDLLAVPSCQSGPGKSCPLDSYGALIAQKSKSQGSFVQTCGLSNSTAAAKTNTATFLRDNALSWEYVVKP